MCMHLCVSGAHVWLCVHVNACAYVCTGLFVYVQQSNAYMYRCACPVTLVHSTHCSAQVAAVNEVGEGDWGQDSEAVEATAPVCAPPPPVPVVDTGNSGSPLPASYSLPRTVQ